MFLIKKQTQINKLAFLLACFFAGLAFCILAQNAIENDNDRALAQRYAPDFYFDSSEKYFPCDYSDFFYKDSQEISGEQARRAYDSMTLGDKLGNFKIFYNIVKNEKETAVQYWLFYVFNDFTNKHYGDAESVTIFIDNGSGQVKKIVGAAHLGSQTKFVFANNELNNPVREHMDILVEGGSHANYPDANGNGLADAQELSNWYNAYGIYNWDKTDASNGIKISHQDALYKMLPLVDLRAKLKNRETLVKAQKLGIQISLKGILPVNAFNAEFYLPLGGDPVGLNVMEPLLKNPREVDSGTWQWLTDKILGTFIGQTDNNPKPAVLPMQASLLDAMSAGEPDNEVLPPRISENSSSSFKTGKNKPGAKVEEKSFSGLLISKICPNINGAGNELIEIYNASGRALELNDENFELSALSPDGAKTHKKIHWIKTLISPAGRFLLIAGNPGIEKNIFWPDATYSAALSANSGIIISDDKAVFDTAAFGKAGQAVKICEKLAISGLKSGQCLIRKSNNGKIINTGNCDNDFEVKNEVCPVNSSGSNFCIAGKSGSGGSAKTQTTASNGASQTEEIPAKFYPVLINEIMYNASGSDTGTEWVEIYNSGNEEIDLSKWKVSEGEASHGLARKLGPSLLKPGGFAVISSDPDNFQSCAICDCPIYKSAISFKNSAGAIILKNQDILINTANYASSSGAYGDGNTLQLINGTWIASLPTPCRINALPMPQIDNQNTISESPTSTENNANATNTQEIAFKPCFKINEIMYNPIEPDKKNEWIEIKNICPESASIAGWSFFEAETNHKLALIKGNENIAPNDFAVICNGEQEFLAKYPDIQANIATSSFSLRQEDKTGEKIAIKYKDNVSDELIYDPAIGADENGNSLQLIDNAWHEAWPTPGRENKLPAPLEAWFIFSPQNPEQNQKITFDASQSINADNQNLKFIWNFGPEQKESASPVQEYAFAATGTFSINLNVINADNNKNAATSNSIFIADIPLSPVYSEPLGGGF